MDKGFWFRRIGFLFPCILRLNSSGEIKLSNKHNLSSFQDVYLNPFYWEALLALKFVPKNIYDLGANFGLFSSLSEQIFNYKKLNTKIDFTLIEANKYLANKLEEIEYHKITNKKKIINGAAGPKKNIFFKSNSSNLLASKISEEGTQVSFVDFNLLPKPDLLKIDIEGAELLLFDNYFDWVKYARAIIIEFHYQGEKYEDNYHQLQKSGFELHIDKFEQSGYRNQLWIKKES